MIYLDPLGETNPAPKPSSTAESRREIEATRTKALRAQAGLHSMEVPSLSKEDGLNIGTHIYVICIYYVVWICIYIHRFFTIHGNTDAHVNMNIDTHA